MAAIQDIALTERSLLDAVLVEVPGGYWIKVPWLLPLARLQHHLSAFIKLIPQEGLLHRTWVNYPGESEDKLLQELCRDHDGTPDNLGQVCGELSQIRACGWPIALTTA